jgi:hypothetical protein
MLDAGGGVAVADRALARCLELQMPLRSRADDEGDWRRGTSRNISRSGALLEGEHWAEPRTPLQMTSLLPLVRRGFGRFCEFRP